MLVADLVVAQEQHRPPAGAHFVLLAGVVVAGLAIFGLRWWRRRHDSAAGGREPTSDDHASASTRSQNEEIDAPRTAGRKMKYALLVHDVPGSWQDLSTEEKRAQHAEYRAVAAFPGVFGHFICGRPQTTTTVRVEDDQIVKTAGPIADARASLRVVYLVESDDYGSILELAAGIPAARIGGAVEVWTLAERY